MSRRLRRAGERLRKARFFAVGVLIGSAIVTPVFAAGEIAIEDLSTPVLIGSLGLLVIALALKAKRAKSEPGAPTEGANGLHEGIGRYRLQLGRGEAD